MNIFRSLDLIINNFLVFQKKVAESTKYMMMNLKAKIYLLKQEDYYSCNTTSLCQAQINIFYYVIHYLFSIIMFAKKSRSNSSLEPPGIQAPSLPKLQQLAALEAQLIDIIGRRHVAIDQDNDIFSRIEELYIAHLQNHSLGLEMLEKCLRVVGDIDAPVRVRLLYYYAHQMKLRGAAADEVEPVLLDCFWANLNLKNKLRVGFKSGLVFCQMSQHNCEVQKIISNLIVAFEQEVGFKMRDIKKIKSHSINQKHGLETMKSIYIGSRINHKSTHKSGDYSTPSKLMRLQLLKDLYETYLTGIYRVQSQAKRRYYSQCLEELRNKLVRQYPGINIENRLNFIESNKNISLKEFNHLINGVIPPEHENSLEVKTEPSKMYQPNRSNSKTVFKGYSEYTGGASTNLQSIGNSFFKETRNSSPTNEQKTKTQSTKNRKSKLRINLKDRSKTKNEEVKKQSEPSDSSTRKENQKNIQILKLVFKEKNESAKGLVLKFQKLQEKEFNKVQIKKKKMKCNFLWSDKTQTDGVDKENKQDININNKITAQLESIAVQQLTEDEPKEEEKKAEQIHNACPSVQDLGEMTSARKIDLIIKQGLEWIEDNISHQHSPPATSKEDKIISNLVFPNANISYQLINTNREDGTKLASKSICDESYSQTHQMNSERREKIGSSHRASIKETQYKIIIVGQEFLRNCEQGKQEIKKRMSFLEHEHIIKIIKEQVVLTINSISNQIVQNQIRRIDLKQSSEIPKSQQVEQIVQQEQQLLEQLFEDESVPVNNHLSFMQTVSDEEEIIEQAFIKQIYQNLPDAPIQSDQEIQKQEDIDLSDIIEEYLQQLYRNCADNLSIIQQEKVQIVNPIIDDYLSELYTEVEDTQPIKKEEKPFSKIVEQFTEENESEEENNVTFLFKGSEDEYDDKDLDSQIESDSSDEICEQKNHLDEPEKHVEILSEEQVQEVIKSLSMNKTKMTSKQVKQAKVVRLSQDNEYFPEKIEEHIIELDKNRPRTVSDDSNISNNLRQISTNRSQKREPTHQSISICYDQNFDTMTEFSKKMEHWLNPELKISLNQIVFSIQHPQIDKIYQKAYDIDGIKTIRDESYKKIEEKVFIFLKNYDNFEHEIIDKSTWEKIIRDIDSLDILPDEIEIKTLMIEDNFRNVSYQVKFMHRAKNNSIVAECDDHKFKTHAIDVLRNDGVQNIFNLLISSNIVIHGEQLLFKNLWVILGQRNIKFKDRYDNTSLHYTFNVYERCSEDSLMFSYTVANANRELSMQFSDVGYQIRRKIWNNIDTIIGFCLKQVNRKIIMFNTQDIHAFLRLL